eukprot:bmy_20001T0
MSYCCHHSILLLAPSDPDTKMGNQLVFREASHARKPKETRMFGYIIYSDRCIEMHLPYIAQAMESNKDVYNDSCIIGAKARQKNRSLKDFSLLESKLPIQYYDEYQGDFYRPIVQLDGG